MLPEDYLQKQRNKRNITSKRFKNLKTTSPIKNIENNSHRLVKPTAKKQQLQNSLFVKTVEDWNQLPDKIVTLDSIDCFKAALQDFMHQN